VLADFSSLVGFKARENGIDFILKAETALPDPVNSDPTRVRQILSNVVGNAIKFTKKGAVHLTVSYHESLLRFVVKDSGVGISELEASRLFQAFGQADASTTRKFGGTGLGLVLTKRLAQALGGDFWLEKSEVGVGSTFIVEINVATPQNSKMIQGSRFTFSTLPAHSIFQNRTLLEGKRVLVVEDSPDNQMLLRVLLTRYGARVELADDGLLGVDKALLGDFDIVLMDVQMPRMDGYEAVALLRSRGFKKPVVALTAHAMIEEREKCLNAGYSEFLSKPIDRIKLLDVLCEQLGLS
jgi:CheY-like chemotaxis protein/anti-sigma regulatory factor (Ser/Thr protein kinase)